MVPSPAGLGDPSPNVADEPIEEAAPASHACTTCSENAALLQQVLELLETERTLAVERETRMMRELQLTSQRLKEMEEELVEVKSAITSSSSVPRGNRERELVRTSLPVPVVVPVAVWKTARPRPRRLLPRMCLRPA